MTTLPFRNAMAWLLRRRRPMWQQCLAYASIAFVPALGAAASLEALLTAFGIDPADFERQDITGGLGDFIAAVLVAPLAETVVLGFCIGALSFASRRKVFIAVSSGAIWGVVHARLGVLALVPTGWAFFVFSCAYITWRRDSYRSAFIAAAVAHGLYNATLLVAAVLFPGL